MDHFFWRFQKACEAQHIKIDWFFPNTATHGAYHQFRIIPALKHLSLEQNFLNYIEANNVQYSYIITHFVELCTPFFKSLKRLQNSKVIAVDHNPRPLHGYPLKKRIKKRLKGWLFSRYIDQFVGVSDYTVNEILKDFGNHIRNKSLVIYNGIAIENIIVNENRKKTFPKCLVASHLRPSKGVQDLIEAVYQLPESVKYHIKIDVYGEGPYEEILKNKVNSLSLNKIFSFKGSVANLNEIYCLYDYMLQPTHMECFSLSILESLAANVPVITTPVGGNTEVVKQGRNGFIFETKNIKALAQLLEKMVKGDMYINGNTRTLIKEKFSIDTMVVNHLKLLEL
ncbi:glycosyltransferase family 4 protein [Tamlana fucoidanivorans]|uniref:Glycosyltransferase family 4 protein n=2 Tax=Allotamlana fucoidanivorans TaxID=2583814 RepID=A0A5C4SNW1_9FLAO|nr:glycosyltransferase family 4 protein [Tamlana fucoidanivorans]